MKTTFAVILSLFCLNLSSVRADDSDIFGANVEPNVMILIDTSGSMWDTIDSTSYDPKTDYTPQGYSTDVVYQRINGEYSIYKNKVNDVPNSNAQTALGAAGFWSGSIAGTNVSLSTGRFLNYQNCPPAECTGQEAKIDIARRVVTDLINYVDGVRFGVMNFVNHVDADPLFDATTGRGGMVAPIGTSRTDMAAGVQGINGSLWCCFTPTGEQLSDASDYFRGTYNVNSQTYPSPIQYACQPNFVIIISDGIQNGPLPVQDVATDVYSNLLTNDHSTLLDGIQNVIVHTVGFDITGNQVANDSLIDAAANGGGTFFPANNSAELSASLQDAIRQIIGSVFTFATPVVPTTSVTGSNRAYIAAVQSDPSSPSWRGFLKAYDRDTTDGSIRLDGNGKPDSTYLAWEAGDLLKQAHTDKYGVARGTAASRKIYYLGGGACEID